MLAGVRLYKHVHWVTCDHRTKFETIGENSEARHLAGSGKNHDDGQIDDEVL